MTRDQEYAYTIDLPGDWVEEKGRIRSAPGGAMSISSIGLSGRTTLDAYAQSVRDNLRQEWWPTASLFEVTSFERRRIGDQESYLIEYRVRESPRYCIVDVVEVVALGSSLPGVTQGFRARHQACDWELPDGLGRTRGDVLDSFRVVTQPAAYYTQFLDANGVTVKASGQVVPKALHTAADVVDIMLADIRPDIRECLVRAGAALAIYPRDERVNVLPEFVHVEPGPWGLGAVKGQPVSAVPENNLVKLPGQGDPLGHTTFHEFAHSIQNICFTQEDNAENRRLYEEAVESNLFPGSYGMSNSSEFFAELTVMYFGVGREVREIPWNIPVKYYTYLERLYDEQAGHGRLTATPTSTPTSTAPASSFAAASPDRDVLVELYRATRGDTWRDNTNWLSNKPLNEWYGVTTDANGRVTQLVLGYNRLFGEIPPTLGNLSNVTVLDLSVNRLSGDLPSELGGLSRLSELSLHNNQLSGQIPSELGNIANLQVLRLGRNSLGGEIPRELGSLSSLRVLDLRSCGLRGRIPHELGNLFNLESLMLYWNGFEGGIPAALGNLSNLESLSLFGAGLSGEIPRELGSLSNLRSLDLRSNGFTGAIPPELGNLSNLEELWLSFNSLSGRIPAELVSLSNLKRLDLERNQLSGPIPAQLGSMSGLESLYLSGNSLSGEVPQELGNPSEPRIAIPRRQPTERMRPGGSAGRSANRSLPMALAVLCAWANLYSNTIYSHAVTDQHSYPDRDTHCHSLTRSCVPSPDMDIRRWCAGGAPDHSTRGDGILPLLLQRPLGIEATGFTVLVGADYEALSPVYGDVVGVPLSEHYHAQAGYTYAWVTSSATGGGVMALMYGTLYNDSLSSLKHHIAHEYFHVLQGQLVTGFRQLQDGEIAWHNDTSARGPFWLVEGLASYADYAYTPSRLARRPFFERYTPYKDLTWFHLEGSATSGDLEKMGDFQGFVCAFPGIYAYSLSFAASTFLVEQAGEDSYVNYWKLVGERPNWQQAFEEAFGTGVDDFYRAFDEWLPSQLLPLVQLKLQMRWPDMENQPKTWRFLYLHVENWGAWENRPTNLGVGWTGLSGLPLYMDVTYDEGAVGTGYVSLWWSDDQCTSYLLGWYKDGDLTSRREDATAVEFTGKSATLDWYIPGHPDTLPHLEEGKRESCR